MTKTIPKKDLYRKLKLISDDVMEHGVVYTVLQNSKPAFYIVPLDYFQEKKYKKDDLFQFIFESKNKKEKNLSLRYKKFLYS